MFEKQMSEVRDLTSDTGKVAKTVRFDRECVVAAYGSAPSVIMHGWHQKNMHWL